MFLCSLSFAQTRTVTGIVKDVDGTGLPGVTIAIKGTPRGTATNPDGEFSIQVSSGDTLHFTFIGKKDLIQVVGQRNVIDVTLYDDETMLDEVVVTTFGTQKKESVIASIQTVNMADLKVPATNLTSALAGRIAGLISYTTTGEPGADNAQFFVRGVTTFGYKTDPLILIDGFEATTDDLARLQPDDIESFSVLKDASATVLYGARGANGIITVQTKMGREGPVRLNIRVDNHVATPTKVPKLTDGVTYMRMYNEARTTRNPILGPYYNEQKIQATARGENDMIYPNIDWYDEIFNKATLNTKVNLNVSGGGQVAKYYISGGYEHESGLLKVDNRNNFNTNIDINRFNLRTNIVFNLTPTTQLEARLTSRFTRYNGPYSSTDEIFYYVMNSNPVDFPAVWEPDAANEFTTHTLFGSSYVDGYMKANPYAQMVRGYKDKNDTYTSANLTLNQDLKFITEGLKFQLKFSAQNTSDYESIRYYNPFYYDLESYNAISGEYVLWCLNPSDGSPYLGDVIPSRNAGATFDYEARFNWDRTFGKHTAGGMVVGIMRENLLTAGNSTSIYETLPEKNMGISGRFTYDFDKRYFAEVSFGYNGSEKFSGDKRFGFFPSFGAGWIVSNEEFWRPISKTFSLLKLKATWGWVGNDAIANRADRFFYLSDISYDTSTTVTSNGYRWGQNFMNSYGGYTINRYANADITWEVSEQRNLGIELGFFEDALKIQADVFNYFRRNIYMTRENFPATSGFEASISGNVGEVESWGFDGTLDYQHFFRHDFWMSARANFTYADNKYVKLDEKDYPDEYRKRLGHNINQGWGLIAERLFVDEEEIRNSPEQTYGSYMAGDIKYKDVNGDGKIDDNDMVPMGHPTSPEIQYGFGVSVGYKDFDLSFFLQGNARVSMFINSGVGGGDDGTEGIAPFAGRRNALEIVAKDYWSETNPDVYAFWPRLSTTAIENNIQQSSWWLRDASFLRLKQVEAGYTFKKGWKKVGLNNARIYISGENLLCFSPFKLWDPEKGRKGLGYPPNKRFNIGFQLQF